MNVYVLNLVNNLAKLGHEVDVYTRVHKESDEEVVKMHKQVRIIHLTTDSPDLYQDILLYAKKLMDFIEKNSLKYDIIHTHYFYSGLVGLTIKKMLQLPIIHTFHTLGSIKATYSGIKDTQRIKAEQQIINQATGIIVSTELEKKELNESYKAGTDNIFVISPGVNHHLFRNYSQYYARDKIHLSQKPKIILFAGRIDPIKGIRFLISAVALFNKDYPAMKGKLQVILIGGDIKQYHFWENLEVKKITRLIHQKHLERCIEFIGSRPHYLLPFYYSAADLVVMPSIYESFGFVALEAMACGTAVIAAKTGGLNYLIKDKVNGRLFESGNIKELCEIMHDLLTHKQKRVQLKEQAIIYSQKFCWEKQIKKFIEVYQHYL